MAEVAEDRPPKSGTTRERSEGSTESAGTDRVRVQFDFSQEAYDRLQELKDTTEARSNAEVIRKALQVYEWVLTKQQEGYDFQLVKGDRVREVELVL